jgi:hypothetical protein
MTHVRGSELRTERTTVIQESELGEAIENAR